MKEIELTNESLAITILPEIGGRIENFVDKKTRKDWVWHPQGYTGGQRQLPAGADFDDNWTGGWDEVFPSDAAGEFQGMNLVDHGELWSQPWHVVEESRQAVRMRYDCRTMPVTVEKTMWLDRKKPHLSIDYDFHNVSDDPLPCLFKLHAALAIEAEDRIMMPSCLVRPVDLGFSTLVGSPDLTRFPVASGRRSDKVMLDRVPGPEVNEQEFLYATDLAHGSCGLKNSRTGTILRMAFDKSAIPYVWLFQSYGRWHNHYVMVMEPCTNVPYDLTVASQSGTCAVLESGSRKELRISIGLACT